MQTDYTSPFTILKNVLTKEDIAAIEGAAATVQESPTVIPLGDLKTPEYGNDPNELFKDRFLYRGGICMLFGPTGIGKSSFLLQSAIYWSVGRGFFGIEPGDVYRCKGMKILLVQAENDHGDLAEMRDGVTRGCEDLTETEIGLAGERIHTATINDKTSDSFSDVLGSLIVEQGPYDLVMVDPAFAYLGGDGNSQKDVSHFMRELLNPLLQKHQVGLVLAHHTNKPLRGREKEGWAAGDYAYLGAGSAEWINPARAALAFRSLGSDRVFELRAPKRGRRLRWTDADGEPTTVQYIAHHDDPGVICWRKATPEEVEETKNSVGTVGRPAKCTAEQVTKLIAEYGEGKNQSEYTREFSQQLRCSQTAVQNAIVAAVGHGLLREETKGRSKSYCLQDKDRRWAKTGNKRQIQ